MMQTDVKQSRLTQTGWIVSQPCRVKGVSLRSNGSATGRVFLFDTNTAPVTASYGQSTTTVTVTSTAHGLSTGDTVSIGYVPDGSQRAATCGTYTITKTGADTFTITDPNSFTVTSSTACYYVTGTNRWIYVKGVSAADQYINYELLPGEGLQAKQKVYVLVLGGMQSCIVYYG
mgnify:FL=1